MRTADELRSSRSSLVSNGHALYSAIHRIGDERSARRGIGFFNYAVRLYRVFVFDDDATTTLGRCRWKAEEGKARLKHERAIYGYDDK